MLAMLLTLVTALAACTPAAAPTPTPTKAPAAAPTQAAVTKPPEATKPPAQTPTAPAAATATPKAATIKLGTAQAVSDAAVFIAMEKGYFKEQGITLELSPLRSLNEGTAPLATGQLDAMVGSLSAGLLAAIDRGVELKIVAEKSQSIPKWEFNWVMLRKDLADSGKIKTIADLKGMKVAIPSPGSIGEQAIQIMMEQAGLKPGDVEMVVLAPADQAAAFANQAIAAGYNFDPFIARAVQEGFAVKWVPASTLFGGKLEAGIVVFGPALLKDQDLARRWMIPYIRGVRDYLKAFTTKEGRGDVINILVKNSTVKDPKLYDVMEMPYIDPNGQLDKKSMDAQYKWYVEKGLYAGKKTFDDIIELSFVDYAVQQLGKQ